MRNIDSIISECINRFLNEEVENGYDLNWINQQFDGFNDKYFEGRLDKIPILTRKLTTSNAIAYYAHKNKKDIWASMNGNVKIYPTEESIVFNTSFKPSTEEILNSLIHEMCHQYAWEIEISSNTYTEEEWNEFCKEYKATQGHDTMWQEIAQNVSNESGYKITRYSDTAAKTDEAMGVLNQMKAREKEIVLGVAHLSSDYYAFLTTRACVGKLEYNIANTYRMTDGDDKFTWFTFHTNALNDKRGWCSKSNLANALQRVGDSVQEAVNKIIEHLKAFNVIIEDLQPLVIEQQKENFNSILCLHNYIFASKYPYILFKPTPKIIKALKTKPNEYYTLIEVDSEEFFRHVASSDSLGRGWLTNKATEKEIEDYLNRRCTQWRKL